MNLDSSQEKRNWGSRERRGRGMVEVHVCIAACVHNRESKLTVDEPLYTKALSFFFLLFLFHLTSLSFMSHVVHGGKVVEKSWIRLGTLCEVEKCWIYP